MNVSFIFREAFRGLGRNITMSIALVITTAISLALVGTGILLSQVTSDTKEMYLDRVEVMIELDEEISATDKDCSSAACMEVRDTLQADAGVESVTFRSREQSYDRFVELFGETDPILVEETSPDALPAALHVRLEDPTNSTPLDAVRDMPQVALVVDQAEGVRTAADNLDSFRNATFVVAALQALAAIFLIGNMVQLAAYHRRDEMGIMRMVGASRWFTNAPFVLEAALSVLIGGIVATLGVWLGKTQIVDPMLSEIYSSQLIAKLPDSAVWSVMPLVAVVGVIAAGIVAQITLRLYVRK
ncbi:permease-like cell division protein FtsX [Corynebacterium cystitidis]|uniref:Cell division protein FtsX n=1 Tax=Corynebacterium cystitidis DSM 20524 TaxID=1121357 RepID=A0A1H9WCZ4_9CORY|nr:permease-like cell division protein FtsX [Corynebacterium cystitidis]WJY81837.1 Cell division protein FtsX [Corynebacterium cystitidis DSM 20524]SES31806.1 cell division transport system permease protein [Corynebacterium cystitidis DSM 20524]SNV83004.1 cell division protein FtsX [Corynebacterium cystitidis]